MKQQRFKKVSAGYIERAALHYLGRFSSSEANLRAVLERKVRRRNQANNNDSDENYSHKGDDINTEHMSWIDDVVSKCVKYGYIDDVRYADERSRGLLRKGKPLRTIKLDLVSKGISPEVISNAIAALELHETIEGKEIDADLFAAISFVKRRRFGPFRREMSDIDANLKFKKELASMARIGFGFDLAKKVLKMEEGEALEFLR
jgi:regulatory protein